MQKKIPPAIIAGAALLSHGALAEPDGTWKGDAELGVLATNGNTKTKNIDAKLKVVNDRERWRHTLNGEVLNSSEQGSTTAERYFVSGKSDLKLTERSYVFGLLTYENDRFSGYDHRVTETLGYGRNIIKSDTLNLDLEAGLGARQSKLSASGENQNEAMLHLAGGLEWKLSNTSTFSEDLSSDIGRKSTVTKSVTALKTQIAGNLASKLSFTAKHTSQVPAGITKLDTETAVTLVYGFQD
jgi:putative salt-induced outer membrane protein